MIKILTIVGARPQLIKASAISRAINQKFSDSIHEILLHTGQHYDGNMSAVFIEELGLPQPTINLEVGSASHATQTARMIEGIEKAIFNYQPNVVLVYGDTNSTCAGALAAAKLQVPVVHIEAGLRSFNKKMPEEVNRIVTDHVSTLLFSPTEIGFDNLVKEGFNRNSVSPHSASNPKIYHCGDIMYDNSLYFAQSASERSKIKKRIGLSDGGYILSTVHRPSNTDIASNLIEIVEGLLLIARNGDPIVAPLHPRMEKAIRQNLPKELYDKLTSADNIHLIPPVSYLEMVDLEKGAKMIITDSGGVQKEAFFFQKPCIVLREETEWVELVENGNSKLAGPDSKKIEDAYDEFTHKTEFNYPPFYGTGQTAEFICAEIIKQLG